MTQDARYALIQYFNYQKYKADNTGYSKTVISKIIKNESTFNHKKTTSSFVPHGIEFTDLLFLKFIREMDLALDILRTHQKKSFDFIIMRYGMGLKIKDIAKKMQCSERNCRILNNKGLKLIMKHITTIPNQAN